VKSIQSLENTLHQGEKYTIFSILYTRVKSILKPHQNVNSQLKFAFNNNKNNNRSVSRLLPNFHSFVLVLPQLPCCLFGLSFNLPHSFLFISLLFSTFSPSFRVVAVRTWAGLVVSGGVLGRQGCSHRRPGQPSLPRGSPGLGSDVIQRSKEGQGAFSIAENQPGSPG